MRIFAPVITILGGLLLCFGASLVYLPAGIMLSGLLLGAAGLFVIDVSRK